MTAEQLQNLTNIFLFFFLKFVLDKGIDLDCFKLLSLEDINELMPEFCDRIKFKARFEQWKMDWVFIYI